MSKWCFKSRFLLAWNVKSLIKAAPLVALNNVSKACVWKIVAARKHCFCTPTSRSSMAKILLPEGNRLITLWCSCFGYFDRLTIWWTSSDSSYHMVIPTLSKKRNLAFSIGVVATLRCPVAYISVQEGPEKGISGWVRAPGFVSMKLSDHNCQDDAQDARCSSSQCSCSLSLSLFVSLSLLLLSLSSSSPSSPSPSSSSPPSSSNTQGYSCVFCEQLNLHNKLYSSSPHSATLTNHSQ